MVLKIRMTNELYNHVLATAEHIKEDASCVVKAVCIGFLNSRPVAQYEVKEVYYKSGDKIFSVRGIPDKIVADDEFRKYLYRRCKEELQKEVKHYRSYAKEAGIATSAPESIEEAAQMACYVEG